MDGWWYCLAEDFQSALEDGVSGGSLWGRWVWPRLVGCRSGGGETWHLRVGGMVISERSVLAVVRPYLEVIIIVSHAVPTDPEPWPGAEGSGRMGKEDRGTIHCIGTKRPRPKWAP